MNFEEARIKLSAIGQEHILKYWSELSDEQKTSLLKQIEETDMSVLSRIDSGSDGKRGAFSPLAAMQCSEIEARQKELFDAGVKTIKEGKTAALLLAGGMGTRLGSDEPKGMYNIGVSSPFIFLSGLFLIFLMLLKKLILG